MANQPAPWERQPNESPEAFHAFTLYRDLGPARRSLDAVGKELEGTRTGTAIVFAADRAKSKRAPAARRRNGRISQWSREWNWVDRAARWDELVDNRLREKQLDEIERMAKRQAQHAELILTVLMRPVVELAQALQDPNRAVALATAPISTLFEMATETAAKLPRIQEAERLARGVRVMDLKKGPTQGGTAIWEVDIHQPPREGPEPDFSGLGAAAAPEWDGDTVARDDDDD